MKSNWEYLDCTIDFYFKPKTSDVHDFLLKINNNELNYGIFNPMLSIEETDLFYQKTLVCLIKHKGIPIGFYYFYILDESIPFVHLGLIIIKNNPGYDIAYTSEKLGILFLKSKLKKHFFVSTITTIPRVIEFLDTYFENIFPSPKINLDRSPTGYKQLISILKKEYIDLVFPYPSENIINYKRFILCLQKRESGFVDNFHILPKAMKFVYNSFCQTWLNYEHEEDLILIGKCTFKSYIKLYLFKYKIQIMGLLK
jgi:hypothetical protein